MCPVDARCHPSRKMENEGFALMGADERVDGLNAEALPILNVRISQVIRPSIVMVKGI